MARPTTRRHASCSLTGKARGQDAPPSSGCERVRPAGSRPAAPHGRRPAGSCPTSRARRESAPAPTAAIWCSNSLSSSMVSPRATGQQGGQRRNRGTQQDHTPPRPPTVDATVRSPWQAWELLIPAARADRQPTSNAPSSQLPRCRVRRHSRTSGWVGPTRLPPSPRPRPWCAEREGRADQRTPHPPPLPTMTACGAGRSDLVSVSIVACFPSRGDRSTRVTRTRH